MNRIKNVVEVATSSRYAVRQGVGDRIKIAAAALGSVAVMLGSGAVAHASGLYGVDSGGGLANERYIAEFLASRDLGAQSTSSIGSSWVATYGDTYGIPSEKDLGTRAVDAPILTVEQISAVKEAGPVANELGALGATVALDSTSNGERHGIPSDNVRMTQPTSRQYAAGTVEWVREDEAATTVLRPSAEVYYSDAMGLLHAQNAIVASPSNADMLRQPNETTPSMAENSATNGIRLDNVPDGVRACGIYAIDGGESIANVPYFAGRDLGDLSDVTVPTGFTTYADSGAVEATNDAGDLSDVTVPTGFTTYGEEFGYYSDYEAWIQAHTPETAMAPVVQSPAYITPYSDYEAWIQLHTPKKAAATVVLTPAEEALNVYQNGHMSAENLAAANASNAALAESDAPANSAHSAAEAALQVNQTGHLSAAELAAYYAANVITPAEENSYAHGSGRPMWVAPALSTAVVTSDILRQPYDAMPKYTTTEDGWFVAS